MVNIYTDGGSRGNPGEAGIGYCFEKENEIIYEYARPIGISTNNVAEYTAVLEAIIKAKKMNFLEINIFLDSQLVERQLNGYYSVKSEDLKEIYEKIKKETNELKSFTITHIKRNLNKNADRLVNISLDTKMEYENITDKSLYSNITTNYEKITDFLRVYNLQKSNINIKDENFYLITKEEELNKILIIYPGLKDILKREYEIKNIILRIEDI